MIPEDILSTKDLVGLSFKRGNMIDFWIVGLVAVETEEIPKGKIVCWIRNYLQDANFEIHNTCNKSTESTNWQRF